MLVGAASFGIWFFLTLYLQQVLGYSALKAGLAFVPMTVAIIFGSTFASRSVIRFGAKPLLIVGLLALAAGLLLFTGISVDGHYYSDVLAGSLLIAVGIGFTFVTGAIAAVSGVAPHEAGLASGLINASRLFGGALGLAILAAIATAHTNGDLKHRATLHAALTSGFQLAFAVAAAIAFVGALVALVGLPKVPARGRASSPPAVTPGAASSSLS
jgi:MFS family permease